VEGAPRGGLREGRETEGSNVRRLSRTERAGWRAFALRRRQGSAAIVGVAVIVLVGLIGASMVSSTRVAGTSQAYRSMAVQSLYVAEAGVEWASKYATATDAPKPFGPGQFEVVSSGEVWNAIGRVGEAKTVIECNVSPNPPSTSTGDGGLEYVLRSRYYDNYYDINCRIMNTSEESISFNAMRITWGSPSAFFERVQVNVFNGPNYGAMWRNSWESPKRRWGSGEKRSFNKSGNGGTTVTVPAHYTFELRLERFSRKQSGNHGGRINMRSTEATIEFYMGDELVGEIEVGLVPS
jgi:hypothetical protein